MPAANAPNKTRVMSLLRARSVDTKVFLSFRLILTHIPEALPKHLHLGRAIFEELVDRGGRIFFSLPTHIRKPHMASQDESVELVTDLSKIQIGDTRSGRLRS